MKKATQADLPLLVGWDSEFNTADGHYEPISDQLYCGHCNQGYFIEHIGRQISFEELFSPSLADHPGHTDIRLVCHYDKAELMGLEEGAGILFEDGAR